MEENGCREYRCSCIRLRTQIEVQSMTAIYADEVQTTLLVTLYFIGLALYSEIFHNFAIRVDHRRFLVES